MVMRDTARRGGTASLSLKALQAFVAAVDSGSITRAAERLGVTQPAVSVAIQELESAVGVGLIDRTTRPLSATRAGLELHKRATALLAQAESMLAAVTSVGLDKMPCLRLGVAGPMMGSTWIFEMQSLAEELHVLGGLSIDLTKSLQGRKLDAAVLSDYAMHEHPGLEHRLLLEEPYLLVLPAGSAPQWRNASFRAMAENLPLVRYAGRTTIGRAVEIHLRRCGLELPHKLEFETSNTVLEMVQAGLGWTITTPLCIAESRLDLSSIVIKPLPAAPAPRRLHLVNFAGALPMADRIRGILATSLEVMLKQSFQGPHAWLLGQLSFDQDKTLERAALAAPAQ